MITIIIPTYNRGKTLLRAINSVLNQTYKDFEVIVVDDNSSDDTELIVSSINDSRVRFVKHSTNLGANAARNTGIDLAKGKYIAFQDSDDEWFENKLEKQINYLLRNPEVDIVACSFNKYSEGKVETLPSEEIGCDIQEKLLWGNFISTQTIIGKKECFIEEKFDTILPRFQDWELMIRMSRRYKIYFMNEPLVNVYVQGDSISKNPLKAVNALKKIMEKHNDLIYSNNKLVSLYYRQLATYSMQSDQFNEEYYYYALKHDIFNMKNIIDFLLCKAKLYNILRKIHKIS